MSDFEELRKKSIEITKKKISESVSRDQMIINAINNIEEFEKNMNGSTGRLREWFALVNPELEKSINDNDAFARTVFNYEPQNNESVMGSELPEDDIVAIKSVAAGILGLAETKKFLLVYLEKVMKEVCPNVLELAGPTIGAKLMREAKSLKRLASLQSSTVQLLGAEKALFRHIKTGAKSPKYGHIINHPIIMNAKKGEKGKAARAMADKLSMCARLDYFKGEFMADTYLKELKEKFN